MAGCTIGIHGSSYNKYPKGAWKNIRFLRLERFDALEFLNPAEMALFRKGQRISAETGRVEPEYHPWNYGWQKMNDADPSTFAHTSMSSYQLCELDFGVLGVECDTIQLVFRLYHPERSVGTHFTVIDTENQVILSRTTTNIEDYKLTYTYPNTTNPKVEVRV